MIDDKKWKTIVSQIPNNILTDLWSLSQIHDYASVRQERDWNDEDEFWRQISYAFRERG